VLTSPSALTQPGGAIRQNRFDFRRTSRKQCQYIPKIPLPRLLYATACWRWGAPAACGPGGSGGGHRVRDLVHSRRFVVGIDQSTCFTTICRDLAPFIPSQVKYDVTIARDQRSYGAIQTPSRRDWEEANGPTSSQRPAPWSRPESQFERGRMALRSMPIKYDRSMFWPHDSLLSVVWSGRCRFASWRVASSCANHPTFGLLPVMARTSRASSEAMAAPRQSNMSRILRSWKWCEVEHGTPRMPGRSPRRPYHRCWHEGPTSCWLCCIPPFSWSNRVSRS